MRTLHIIKSPVSSLFRPDATSWDKFHVAISKEELYHENDPVVDALLNDMTRMEFLNISKTLTFS